MVATELPTIAEQTTAREALAAVIAETTASVLAAWEDDQLLGQWQAKTIARVKRAVRTEVTRAVPELIAQVTPWRLRRLFDETVPRAVRMAQGGALRRRMEAEGDLPSEFEFVVGEPTNGITVIDVSPSLAKAAGRQSE